MRIKASFVRIVISSIYHSVRQETHESVGSRNHLCKSQIGRNTERCTQVLVCAYNRLEGSTGNMLGAPHPHTRQTEEASRTRRPVPGGAGYTAGAAP